jgi:D-glycero-D-manno-heptose 1,7-bisphosphate phosphatase
MALGHPAVFLDKDGTLIVDVPYNVDPKHIRLEAGVAAGVRMLYDAGYSLVVITNQAGIAQGYFTETALSAVEQRLIDLLDVPLTGFYYCPHHPAGTVADYAIACDCRKPEPGLLLQAALDHHLDLRQSWMVGDILNDVEAAHRAGCRAVLIHNGNETEWLMNPWRSPDYMAPDLAAAATFILHHAHDDALHPSTL